MHKTVNVLNKLPPSVQKAKADLHAIYKAASRAEAALDRFLAKYGAFTHGRRAAMAADRRPSWA